MRPFRALIHIGIKSQFPPAVLWRQIRLGPNSGRILGLTLIVTIASLPLLYQFILFVQMLYMALHAAGQESALIGLSIMACQMLVFILGLFYVISAFYFSNDLELLIPLPLRPRQVVLSKLAVLMLNEYVSILPVAAPPLIGYGILARPPLDYWILLVPVYLLLPVIPLALVAVLSVGLMRVVNLSRKKDAMVIVGLLLLIVLQIFIQTRARSMGSDNDAILKFFTDKDNLLRLIGRNFPPAVWASRCLTHGISTEGVSQFLLLVGVSALLFLGLAILSEKLFYQGVIGLNEIAAKRRKLTRAEMEKRISSGKHPVRAIFLKEFRLMNRTPIFLLNGILVGVIIPAIFLAVTHSNTGGNPFSFILKGIASSPPSTMVLAMAAFFLVCGCFNGTASSAFSREGKYFWISKVIPVPISQQIAAKFFHSFLVSLVGIVASALVVILVVGAPAGRLIQALILALAGSVALNTVNLRIDLAHPLLNWTNPQRAIKQNFNVFLALLINMSSLVICGSMAKGLMKAGLSGGMIYIILLAVALALARIAWLNLMSFGEKKYPEISA